MWPPAPEPGPWLSRPMRATVGLPSPEAEIGLAAHDFLAAAVSAPTVILSCAERRDGAPAVPARWLTRLETLLAGAKIELPSHPAVAWARSLDHPLGGPKPVSPPRPCPPVAVRPVAAERHRNRDVVARSLCHLREAHPAAARVAAAGPGNRRRRLRRARPPRSAPVPERARHRLARRRGGADAPRDAAGIGGNRSREPLWPPGGSRDWIGSRPGSSKSSSFAGPLSNWPPSKRKNRASVTFNARAGGLAGRESRPDRASRRWLAGDPGLQDRFRFRRKKTSPRGSFRNCRWRRRWRRRAALVRNCGPARRN